MKNTIVLSAFPGLGKTTFFNKCKESKISVLDSDSINFSWLEGGTDSDGSNETRVRNPDFPNNFIQYIVSLASLYEIEILAKKSFSDCPPIASSMFAPIEVPHLRTCLDIINSFFSYRRCLYKFTIRTAKAKDLC